MSLRLVTLSVCVFVMWFVACTQAQVTSPSVPTSNNLSVQTSSKVSQGTWGGQGISLEVTDEGAAADFDCAHGNVTELMASDREGKFEAKGTFVRESFGPTRRDSEPNEQRVIYSGKTDGKTMTLTIKDAGSGEVIATYELTHGRNGRVRKCK